MRTASDSRQGAETLPALHRAAAPLSPETGCRREEPSAGIPDINHPNTDKLLRHPAHAAAAPDSSSAGSKPCVRCLLEDMPDQAALAENLRELISLIPEDLRAPDGLAKTRLRVCRLCEFLSSGTCSLCGCYVEHRAAKLHGSCPAVPQRWK